MKLEHLAENLYTLSGIPVYLYSDDNKIISYSDLIAPQKLEDIIAANRYSVLGSIDEGKVSRLKDISELSYIGFKIEEWSLVIGPFLVQEIKYQSINLLKGRLKLINEDSIMTDTFFDSLKLLSTYEIDYIYNSVKMMSGIVSDVVRYINVSPEKVKISQKDILDKLFEEFEYVRRNYEIEDRFMKIIESGDIKKASDFPTNLIMVSLPKRATNNSLRNAKTRLTIFNTLSNRAAIRGGIDVQLGHQISTSYGILIENMKSIFDNDKLTKEIIFSYTEAVNNYSLKEYSKLIKEAILHIRRNITSSYNLEDLSHDLFITKEHLSRQFKKELGVTVSSYIKNSKVIEAKKLLKEGKHSVMSISSILGFSNSSHFSSVFKSKVGLSPVKYKNKHMQKENDG